MTKQATVSIGEDSTAEPELAIKGKAKVQQFWDADPCGSRYLGPHPVASHESGKLSAAEKFEKQSRIRYALEHHILDFADFKGARGKRVLEIGVGMGADYLEWLKAGAQATGIDLSPASLDRARLRCELAGYNHDLRVADAESLPFPDNSFDLVYSYGVMHHSPDTPVCIQEARRVLKSGGEARIMLYHHPSITGLMLWLRYGIWRGKSFRRSVYDHLESPRTKTYTRAEAVSLMRGFENVKANLVFSPGDLLLHEPSVRFQAWPYRLFWKLYPRWLVTTIAGDWKLFLLITGTKVA
jgi:ubiquinone/menaquinone biosynthesis C-methylase UbiE